MTSSSTLEKIAALPDLQNGELFLADWDYNIAVERKAAQENHRITVTSLDIFNNLSPDQWGRNKIINGLMIAKFGSCSTENPE